MTEKSIFQRTELLLGSKKMSMITSKKVIIFGIGGVGSWCAESLVRSGIRKLTIIDSDRICVTNINRQLHATTKTVGQPKTDVLKLRLQEINPYSDITAIQKIYNRANHPLFELDTYDYIIDAIDSLGPKLHLIRMATRTHSTFYSSMGASLKVDPTRIRVGEFSKVKGCPLASMIKKRIKGGDLPAKDFLCVYSDEVLEHLGENTDCGTDKELCPKNNAEPDENDPMNHGWCSQKKKIHGTTSHITAIFGFTLAGLVIQSIYKGN